jgi:hypothetical protein
MTVVSFLEAAEKNPPKFPFRKKGTWMGGESACFLN